MVIAICKGSLAQVFWGSTEFTDFEKNPKLA